MKSREMLFQEMPIKRKITRVILLTTVTVVLLTVAAFVTYDYQSYRAVILENLQQTGSLLVDQSRATLHSTAPGSASRVLDSLRTNPRVTGGGLFDESGKALALYPPSSKLTMPRHTGPASGTLTGYKSLGWYSHLDGGPHGKVLLYLESDAAPLQRRMRQFALMALAILLLATLAAAVIGNALQARISKPIMALVQKVSAMSGSAPPPQLGNRDEASLLTEAFDQMLAKVKSAAEARSFMAAIVASADSAIIGKSLDGKVVSWNAGATGMFGYQDTEVLGKDISDLLVPPEQVAEYQHALAEVRQGRVYHGETILKRKGGQLVPVSVSVSPIKSEDDIIIGASYMALDISARRQAERDLDESQARFSSIISSAMDAIISVDEHQRVTIFNASAERMFKCPQSEALGKPLDKFIPARFREAHRHHVAQFGSTGTTSRAMGKLLPLSALRSDGEEFPIEASISQSTVNGRKTFTVILRDITERKEAEEQAQRFSAELEKRVKERTAELMAANREMESFTYSVAHDLRAPLRHIDAFSSILEEDYASILPDEARQYLANIQRGSRSMSRLVDDLLNLARVGRQELNYEPVSLEKLVQDSVRELTSEAKGRTIEWRLGRLPEVKGDSGLLRQVISNLLSNAVKYTRPKSPAIIEVAAEHVDGEERVVVKDNGVGFNMSYVGKLFGVFQRLHRAEDFEGTGVGLAIVDRVVRRHGGRVWAESTLNEGATFYFTLPANAPNDSKA